MARLLRLGVVSVSPAWELTEAVLRPVRSHHAFEACVEQLATAIRLGVYPNGTTLPAERELAERLTISRATVREAITALRTAGMVETRRGRGGGSVVTYSPARPASRGSRDRKAPTEKARRAWLDALTFRQVVEPGACAAAASRELTPADRAQLQSALDEVTRTKGAGAHRQADSRFHLTLATLSESPLLIAAVTKVQASVHEMLLQIPVYDVNIAHSDRQHAAIVRAVLAGRPQRARTIMEEHCNDTAALLRGLLG